jgi:ureidoglycolate lyase
MPSVRQFVVDRMGAVVAERLRRRDGVYDDMRAAGASRMAGNRVEEPVVDTIRVKVDLLTAESFAPYGMLLAIADREPDFRGISSVGWKAHFACSGPAAVMLYSSRYTGLQFSTLERHVAVTQAFIPIGRVPAIVAVAAPTDDTTIPAPEAVHAFLLDGSAGYILHAGTWHSPDRYPLYPPSAEVVIITAQETQHELETVERQHWRLTQAVDYAQERGVTFAFEL